jgi:hypothetical protein
VYNLATIQSKPPYILLVNQTANENNTKGGYADNVAITVQCITEFTGPFGGDVAADRMASAVIEKITENRPNYGTTENFDIITCQISANETLRQQTETDTYITRQITFIHFVEQKN